MIKSICHCLPAVVILSACSSESRDRLWQTLDPAGYKHARSEVFNPKGFRKYQRVKPDDSSADSRGSGELDFRR